MDQYRDRYTVTQIDKNNDTIEFANGIILRAGEALGDISEGDVRRIQIRETVKAHFEKSASYSLKDQNPIPVLH